MMGASPTPAMGELVKKIALLLVLAAFAAAPAAAAPKKPAATPKNPQDMTFDEAMAYNKKNLSLIVQGLPLVLPTWSLPIVFSLQKDADKAKPEKKPHHVRKHPRKPRKT
jgi:hypothetical protein